jgi:uncharacterized protein YdcH (DUF465 family)
MTSLEAYRLRVYSDKLDVAIREEAGRRVPDAVRLTRMKKLRLLLRDKIAQFMRQRARA